MRTVRQPDKMAPGLALVETPLPKLTRPSDVLVRVAATAPCYGELAWASRYPGIFPARQGARPRAGHRRHRRGRLRAGPGLRDLWRAVKDGGDLISVSDLPHRMRPEGCAKKLNRSEFFIVKSLGSQLTEIAHLVARGLVRPLVDSVYELEDYQKAFDKLDQRSARGKNRHQAFCLMAAGS
ncbi:hypothetical protein E4U41_005064 [Claviceps citrina]|nr:hypothetical protein E4U41_005064 [Claviceps citrina]